MGPTQGTRDGPGQPGAQVSTVPTPRAPLWGPESRERVMGARGPVGYTCDSGGRAQISSPLSPLGLKHTRYVSVCRLGAKLGVPAARGLLSLPGSRTDRGPPTPPHSGSNLRVQGPAHRVTRAAQPAGQGCPGRAGMSERREGQRTGPACCGPVPLRAPGRSDGPTDAHLLGHRQATAGAMHSLGHPGGWRWAASRLSGGREIP